MRGRVFGAGGANSFIGFCALSLSLSVFGGLGCEIRFDNGGRHEPSDNDAGAGESTPDPGTTPDDPGSPTPSSDGGIAPNTPDSGTSPTPTDVGLSDPQASSLTRAVFANLRALPADSSAGKSARRVVFGQQESDTSNRATNSLAPIRSDAENVAGKLPGLVSYEMYAAYPGSTSLFDIDGLNRGLPALRALIVDKYEKGVLPSLVWHMRCPKGSPSEGDKFSPSECGDYTLEEMLASKSDGRKGKYADNWKALMNAAADFFASLKDASGQPIPVLFRPFHEFTGNWFWWGRTNKPETYQAVWRAMVSGFRARGVHNVLWVFASDKPTDSYQLQDGGDFEKYYPGDGFVDVVGFDRYDANDGKFASGYLADLNKIGAFARARNKVAAVTEIGVNFSQTGIDAKSAWFTGSMLDPLMSSPGGRGFSYVALWRNAPWEKFMAEPNDGALASDFRRVASRADVLFADPARSMFKRAAAKP